MVLAIVFMLKLLFFATRYFLQGVSDFILQNTVNSSPVLLHPVTREPHPDAICAISVGMVRRVQEGGGYFDDNCNEIWKISVRKPLSAGRNKIIS